MNPLPRICLAILGLALAGACSRPPTPTTGTEPNASPAGAPGAAGAVRPAPPSDSPPAPAASTPSPPLAPPLVVRFGDVGVGANAAIYIGLVRGYFREEGLDITLVPFDTPDRMVPAIATDQVEVGASGVSAGLFNAIARGVPLQIVAGGVLDEPGDYGAALLVRADLFDGGRVPHYGALRGLRVGLPSMTSSLGANFARLLALANLQEDDVHVTELPPAEMAAAMTNGALDLALIQEPFATRLVQAGTAVRWKSAGDIDPHHQATILMYAPGFAQRHPEAATRFLVAYLRGIRDYLAVIQGGGDRMPIYEILAQYTAIKDVNLYATLAPNAFPADGGLNVASLEADQELWLARGNIPQRADLRAAVDLRYLAAALQDLSTRPLK
jgi:NitT/TauT family transport system substrate-binding protein